MSKIKIKTRTTNQFFGNKEAEDAFRERLKNRMLSYFACVEFAYYKVLEHKDEVPESVLSHLEETDNYIMCANDAYVQLSGYNPEYTLNLFSRLSHCHNKRIMSFYKSMLKTATKAGCYNAELTTWVDVMSNIYRMMTAYFFSSVTQLGYGNFYDSTYQEALRYIERAVKHLELVQSTVEAQGLSFVSSITPSDDTKEKLFSLSSDIIDTDIILRAIKYVDRQSI